MPDKLSIAMSMMKEIIHCFGQDSALMNGPDNQTRSGYGITCGKYLLLAGLKIRDPLLYFLLYRVQVQIP